MIKDKFDETLLMCEGKDEILDFARKYIIHGIPYVFELREEDFFDFRNRISKHFSIDYYQVYIVGSGKLGFSYLKGTEFSYDSDIDVAIVSEELYDRYLKYIRKFQYDIERSRELLVQNEYAEYIKFLKYMAKGWMRPDLLPAKINGIDIKTGWFEFFKSISYDKSEVGNYKVSGGVYKNYDYLEYYTVNSLTEYKKILRIEKEMTNE
ncbi:MAG: hypothetical protein IJT37_00225 [Lachnospiraceae bacterium]|nr:hypothetical protein [Lachnospiraceae bacterium]